MEILFAGAESINMIFHLEKLYMLIQKWQNKHLHLEVSGGSFGGSQDHMAPQSCPEGLQTFKMIWSTLVLGSNLGFIWAQFGGNLGHTWANLAANLGPNRRQIGPSSKRR